MRLGRIIALVGVLPLLSHVAPAQQADRMAPARWSWRNYRRSAPPFATDSAACEARAAADARGMSYDARIRGYESCLSDRGWNAMEILAEQPTCAPVDLRPVGTDSAAVSPLLAELTATLTRRFRPPTPDDSATRLVLTVTNDDVRAKTPGIYETPVPLATRLAVAGAKQEQAQFTARAGETPIQFLANFHPRCVVEFPVRGPERPAQSAYFEFQVTHTARPLSAVRPTYPPALLADSIEGRVIAQFVVDEAGKPEMSTFKVLVSSNAMFSEAVRDAVASMRFAPATLDGRNVRQVVQQPFVFAIR